MKQLFIKCRFSENYKESDKVDSLQKTSEYENNIKNDSRIRARLFKTRVIVRNKRLKKYIKVI